MNRQLSPETDIDSASMGKIADISQSVASDWKHPLMINFIQGQLVPGLLDVFKSGVERVAAALVIRLEQERLRLFAAAGAILTPNKRVRPIRIGSQRSIIYKRCRRPVHVHVRFQCFGTADVTV